jgi:hypothetical protein
MGLACARAVQKLAGTAPRKEAALRADIFMSWSFEPVTGGLSGWTKATTHKELRVKGPATPACICSAEPSIRSGEQADAAPGPLRLRPV